MVEDNSGANSEFLSQLRANMDMSEELRRKVQSDLALNAANSNLNEAQMLARLAQLLSEDEAQKPQLSPGVPGL